MNKNDLKQIEKVVLTVVNKELKIQLNAQKEEIIDEVSEVLQDFVAEIDKKKANKVDLAQLEERVATLENKPAL